MPAWVVAFLSVSSGHQRPAPHRLDAVAHPDQPAAHPPAVTQLKADDALAHDCRRRSPWAACRTIAGYEAIKMIPPEVAKIAEDLVAV
jgi:hypothetical protein